MRRETGDIKENINWGLDFSSINRSRTEWMGIAILMVLLYHCSLLPHTEMILGFFRYGYFGVDIFLLLSGYGLCYSYEKNKLNDFWLHRVKRVLPLYIIQLLVRYIFLGEFQSVETTLHELTNLSIFTQKGNGNWYVNAIMFFYLIFPVLYHSIKKYPLYILMLSYVLSSVLLLLLDINWRQECMIGRLPIFIFGIFIYVSKVTKNDSLLYKGLMVSLFFWNFSMVYDVSIYMTAAAICAIVVLVCNIAVIYTVRGGLISFLGRHSYELFIADYFTGVCVRYLLNSYPQFMHSYMVITLYVVFSFLGGGVFYSNIKNCSQGNQLTR